MPFGLSAGYAVQLDGQLKPVLCAQMKLKISLLASVMIASVANAGDLIVGIGVDDVLDQTGTEALALAVEYHADPFYSSKSAAYGLAVAAHLDEDSDVFIGAGLAAVWSLGGSRWYIEGSFMPGYYDHGNQGTDLGAELEFRTLVGLGYKLDGNHSVSVAIDHKSNSGRERTNPGSETSAVRYRVGF